LDDLIARQSMRCEERVVGQYGRTVAECFVGSMSLNDELVKLGWAVAYREYSKTHVRSEEAARAAKRGIWSSTFQMSAEWQQKRRRQRGSNNIHGQQPGTRSLPDQGQHHP
jgi:endonuclease YncB( thermonuclease family)